MREVSVFLPFRYMLGFPAEVFSSMLPLSSVLKGLLIQSAWMLCAVLLQKLVFRSGIKRYTAIGG
jgi:ABC-2 type transport system permease protein